mmetsp:Transcript_109154/g.315385  ORF Transcript_109154/g.315385 Transcript_109154/m.315385 type:complete len:268 (+) Transcript_109154:605-1408(+)
MLLRHRPQRRGATKRHRRLAPDRHRSLVLLLTTTTCPPTALPLQRLRGGIRPRTLALLHWHIALRRRRRLLHKRCGGIRPQSCLLLLLLRRQLVLLLLLHQLVLREWGQVLLRRHHALAMVRLQLVLLPLRLLPMRRLTGRRLCRCLRRQRPHQFLVLLRRSCLGGRAVQRVRRRRREGRSTSHAHGRNPEMAPEDLCCGFLLSELGLQSRQLFVRRGVAAGHHAWRRGRGHRQRRGIVDEGGPAQRVGQRLLALQFCLQQRKLGSR